MGIFQRRPTVDRAQYDRAVAQRDRAVRDAETWRQTCRTATRQLAEAEAANRRLAGRNRHLENLLAESQEVVERLNQQRAKDRTTAARAVLPEQAMQRIQRLRRACARYRAELHGERLLTAGLTRQLDDAAKPVYVTERLP